MRMCHFQDQDGLFALNKLQTIIITFIHLLSLFMYKMFVKKFLQYI